MTYREIRLRKALQDVIAEGGRPVDSMLSFSRQREERAINMMKIAQHALVEDAILEAADKDIKASRGGK